MLCEYKPNCFRYQYSEKEIIWIHQRALEAAKNNKYFDPKFADTDFIEKEVRFLDKTRFGETANFEEIEYMFRWYVWFVNACLYEDYNDDIQELLNDIYLRTNMEEQLLSLEINDQAYLRDELKLVDNILWVLTDAQNKLQSTEVDNREFWFDDIENKEDMWHLLYYPVNIKLFKVY